MAGYRSTTVESAPWISTATAMTPYSLEESSEAAVSLAGINYVIVTLQVINGTLSIIGNIFNFLIIHRVKTFKRNMKVYMYTLSFADFMTGIVILSIFTQIWFSWLEYVGYFCKLNGFLLSLSPAISSLSLFWIAVDKFCLIHYPFKYNAIFPKSASPVIVTGYTTISCALLFWVSYVDGAFFENIHFDPLYGLCLLNFQNKRKVTSVVVTALAGMGLPVIVLVALYLKMASTAKNQAKRINRMVKSVQRGSSSSSHQNAMLINEWKGFVFFAVVSGAFFLAWLPFWTTKMLYLLTDWKIPPIVYTTSGLLTISNSWWNPIIYTFGNGDFRHNLKKLFKWNKFLIFGRIAATACNE